MNLLLIQAGYPPALIMPEQRKDDQIGRLKNIFADFLVAYEGGETFIFDEAKGTTLYTFKS